jgi:hypothetical protein
VLVPPSVGDDYYAAGGRSFSIRDDDGRSDAKGMEPEGVALLEIRGRTYAFVGLERTEESAVAVFDITNPDDVTFLEMIVNIVANEETGPTVTSLYRVDP